MIELIVLMGFKACGKSTIGQILAKKIGWPFVDLDKAIEAAHSLNFKENLTFREIFKKHGAPYFRQLEAATLSQIIDKSCQVLALGGGTVTEAEGEKYLTKAFLIYLDAKKEVLWDRIMRGGLPPFLDGENPRLTFEKLFEQRDAIYRKLANLIVDNSDRDPVLVADEIAQKIGFID